MTTKAKIAEQVQRILEGGDVTRDDNRDIRELMLSVGQVRDNLVYRSLMQQFSADEWEIGSDYLASYTVTVTDEVATLPVTPLELMDNRGIYSVVYTNDPTLSVIPVNNTFQPLYRNLEASHLEGRIGYKILGKTLTLINTTTGGVPESLDVLMIPSGIDIDEDEDFPVPPEMVDMIIKEVVNLYQPRPHDDVNNLTQESAG